MPKLRKRADQKADRKTATLRPRKAKDIPVTQKMLFEVRDELGSRITSVRSEVKSVRSELKGEIESVRSEVGSLRGEVKSLEQKMDARFGAMDARFSDMKGEFHRLALLIEEQNARNKFVLDGYASLHDKQVHIEQEISEIKKSNSSV